MDSAFEQIRMYSKGDIAVSLRLLRAIGDIAITTQDAVLRKTLFERGRRVVDGCAERIGAEELKPLLVRLTALRSFAEEIQGSRLSDGGSPVSLG